MPSFPYQKCHVRWMLAKMNTYVTRCIADMREALSTSSREDGDGDGLRTHYVTADLSYRPEVKQMKHRIRTIILLAKIRWQGVFLTTISFPQGFTEGDSQTQG